MRISDSQVQLVLSGQSVGLPSSDAFASPIGTELEEEARLREQELVADVTRSVLNMPDREEMIADLKARIDAKEYQISASAIVDAMARRAIATVMKYAA